MKRLKMVIASLVVLLYGAAAHGQAGRKEFTLVPIGSAGVPVTVNKITCIIFPVAIRPAGKGTRDVYAQLVKGTDNVLELKAARPGFAPTNLTVVGANGHLYSLEIRYEADPGILNYQVIRDSAICAGLVASDHAVKLTGQPVDEAALSSDADSIIAAHAFLHRSAGSEEMRLRLRSIYIKDGLIWLAIGIKNHSLLDYHVGYAHFSVMDKKRGKRTALQERALEPLYSSPDSVIAGKGSVSLAFGFSPFTLPPHKKLSIGISEPSGGRLLLLTVKPKMILKARGFHGPAAKGGGRHESEE